MFIPSNLPQPLASSFFTNATSTFFANSGNTCKDISDCRTISDVFKTCLTVIFISIWVSMHPDVPDVKHVGKSDLGSLLNELIVMTITIALPELIILWAVRQRLGAINITRKYRKYGWTRAHAYLAIMGGLALYNKEGEFKGYLRDSEGFSDEEYVLAGEIEQSLKGKSQSVDYPVIMITGASAIEHELPIKSSLTRRMSNGSGNKKAVNNCLSPPVSSPPDMSFPESPYRDSKDSQDTSISPDEGPKEELDVRPKPAFLESYCCLLDYVLAQGLVNLTESEIQGNLSHGDAFAKLSALLSTGWFMVQIIARGIQGLAISELETVTLSFTVLNIAAYLLWWDKPQRIRYPVRITWEPMVPTEVKPTSTGRYLAELVPRLCRELRDRVRADYDDIFVTNDDTSTRSRRRFVLFAPWYAFTFYTYQVGHLVRGMDHYTNPYGAKPVNMFRTGIAQKSFKDAAGSFLSVIIVGVVVGVLHFVAWNSQFPTIFLRIAWHTSAIVVLAVPVSSILTPLLIMLTSKGGRAREVLGNILTYAGAVGYAVARTVLIVLAIVIPLKYGFSESGYRDVDWLKFIPHIG